MCQKESPCTFIIRRIGDFWLLVSVYRHYETLNLQLYDKAKEEGKFMEGKKVKRMLSVVLMLAMAVTLLAGCGGKGNSGDGETGKSDVQGGEDEFAGKNAEFTWWITQTDGNGMYYEDYADCPVVQYIHQQYWDVENGGIGTEETGRKLKFSYLVPISGSESENFNTMIGTGEYPELLVLAMASESPQAMYENGILMDITEYVETYMPNYLAFLDANPEIKPLVQVADDEGNIHYYAIYSFADGPDGPWEGTCYRRDWIVKYAEPTEYVWDWESDCVKEDGHPAVTPLAKAIEEDNLEGWKKNEVTSFHADEGENPAEDYTDNVIFPSGTQDPLTISDWEWMLEAFDKAIKERGWEDDSSAYGFSISYYGYSQMGDLTSSFGGGTGTYYVKDGEVSYDGASENFKTYLECMQTWYKNGWLDEQFNTRANDMFFQINTAGVNQGKVGMWCGLVSTLGTAIRVSCQNPEDQADAYVMGAPLPINDVYGGEKQMYVEPDSLYQMSRKGAPVGITDKAEGKDLAALFTFLDWTYTDKGAKTIRFGLDAEQYASTKLNPDLLAEYDMDTSYTESTDEDGNLVIMLNYNDSDTLAGALRGYRMDIGLKLTGHSGEYTIDKGLPGINKKALEQWTKYLNTGNVLDYSSLLSTEESDQYSKINTAGVDYQSQNVPNVIKGTMSWEDYVKGLEGIDTDTAVSLLQKYVDMANTARR